MTAEPFDLGAAAAATRGEPWSFTFGGQSFDMVGDLPLELIDAYGRFAEQQLALDADDPAAGLTALAGMREVLEGLGALFVDDEAYAAFRALRPGQAELVALLGEVTRRATGAPVGEPLPSSGYSDDGSANSRPISGVTTASG